MNSAMLNRIHRIRSYSLTLISSILILVLVSNIVSSAPTLSYLDRITARSKSNYPEDEFVFLVTYVSPKNKPPLEIKLVIDNNKYDLLPENTLDLNYTDGKDYTIRLTLNGSKGRGNKKRGTRNVERRTRNSDLPFTLHYSLFTI